MELVLAGIAGTLGASPWLWRVYQATRSLARAHPPEAAALAAHEPPLWGVLGPDRNHLLLAVAAAGLGWLFWRLWRGRLADRTAGLSLGGFALVLLALMGPWRIGPFRPDHAAIVLFLPAVLLASDALFELLPRPSAWAVVLLFSAWGLAETRDIVRPDTTLARAGDTAAIEWIDAHTRSDAVFLVDVEPWMNLWRGADGGWWIMPLTGRRSVLPPVAYGWGEPEQSELVRGAAARTRALRELPIPERCAELERLLTETGARYYYTHTSEPDVCGEVETVYRGAGGVRIFALPSSTLEK
jgi:hypothetical protein